MDINVLGNNFVCTFKTPFRFPLNSLSKIDNWENQVSNEIYYYIKKYH